METIAFNGVYASLINHNEYNPIHCDVCNGRVFKDSSYIYNTAKEEIYCTYGCFYSTLELNLDLTCFHL